MKETSLESTLDNVQHRLDQMKSRAQEDSFKFKEIQKQIESMKIRFLLYQLDTRRKFLARARGAAYITEPKKSLPLLGISAGMSILTGMITKDKYAAMNVGIGSINAVLQGLGETTWAVCLGENLEVAPLDKVKKGKGWVTWDSLIIAMHELELKAQEESLGTLDNIMAELRKSNSLVFLN